MEPQGIGRSMAELYDDFVDWDGRLERELPSLVAHLQAAKARRVLDVGCGTGRHVKALRQAGFAVRGADASEWMLERAARHLGGEDGLYRWSLGSRPTAELLEAAPFDAILGVGNVWPQVTGDANERAAAAAFLRLLRPGGTLLLGFKAIAPRIPQDQPYLPLLRRGERDAPLWFVRYLDLCASPLADGTPIAGFRMIALDRDQVLAEEGTRWRVWSPDELAAWFEQVGFEDVRVTGGIGSDEAPSGEDVLVIARRP